MLTLKYVTSSGATHLHESDTINVAEKGTEQFDNVVEERPEYKDCYCTVSLVGTGVIYGLTEKEHGWIVNNDGQTVMNIHPRYN